MDERSGDLASQTIDSMVRRHEQQALSIEDQAWLAVWGVKTAMMWMTVPPGERLIPLEDYHWLRIHKLAAEVPSTNWAL